MTSYADVRACPVPHASAVGVERGDNLSETVSHLNRGISGRVVDDNLLEVAKIDD